MRNTDVVPDTVTTIRDYAFASARFKRIERNQVQTIRANAFAYSALESVVITEDVTFMGDSVFSCNFYLRSVIFVNGLTAIPDKCIF